MRDEAIDFLPLILLLGIIIPICFGLILPNYRESLALSYSERFDKSVQQVQGVKYTNTDERRADFTFSEAVLLLGSQSYYMPYPKILRIGSQVYGIEYEAEKELEPNSTYSIEPREYLPGTRPAYTDMANALRTWCGSGGGTIRTNLDKLDAICDRDGLSSGDALYHLFYNVKFDVNTMEDGVDPDHNDDEYKLCVAAYDEYGNKTYLPCGADGVIKVPKGITVGQMRLVNILDADNIKENLINGVKLYILYWNNINDLAGESDYT